MIVYYCLPSYMNESLTALSNNIDAFPIMDINIIDIDQYDSETLLLDKGYETFCQCENNKITIGECKKITPSCATVTISHSERKLRRWKGKNIVVSREFTDDLRFYSSIEHNYCYNRKSCGKITNETWLCLNKEDAICPINKIVVNNQPSYQEENITFRSQPFGDNLYFHYTNEDPNGTIVISFNVSEGQMCMNAIQQNNDYFLYKGRGTCNNQYDNSYQIIDTISKYRFYDENFMLTVLQELPDYPLKTSSTVNLYSRGYLSPRVDNFYYHRPDILDYNSHSNHYNSLRFSLIILLIIESIIYFLVIKVKYKDLELYFKERTLLYNISAFFKVIVQISIMIFSFNLFDSTRDSDSDLFMLTNSCKSIFPGVIEIINSMDIAFIIDTVLLIIGLFSLICETFFLIRNFCFCTDNEQYNEEQFNKSVLDAPLPISG